MSNKFPEDDFDHDEENDDFNDPKDEIFYSEDEYNDLLDENIELRKENFYIAQKDINETLLNDAILVCSRNFLWYFKSVKTKMKEIKSVYSKFIEMVDENIDPIDI